MRKKVKYKKHHKADVKYGRIDVGRFINYVMRDGKKSTAERLVYSAFDKIKEKTKEEPIKIFEKAIKNASPLLKVISRRVGGANYQIPYEVSPEHQFVFASKWIINAAKKKKGKPFGEKLSEELILASKNEGDAIKKKQETHRIAESNRAFAHFA